MHIKNKYNLFSRISNKQYIIASFKNANMPKNFKELVWKLFVVRSEISKDKLIDLKFIKKSCQAYKE